MDSHEITNDENAIRNLIGAHFQGLKWTPTTQPDWNTFAADFLPDASLYPSHGLCGRKHWMLLSNA